VTTRMTGMLLSLSCGVLIQTLSVRGAEMKQKQESQGIQLEKEKQLVQPSPRSDRASRLHRRNARPVLRGCAAA
jgi:hypothetical protein